MTFSSDEQHSDHSSSATDDNEQDHTVSPVLEVYDPAVQDIFEFLQVPYSPSSPEYRYDGDWADLCDYDLVCSVRMMRCHPFLTSARS